MACANSLMREDNFSCSICLDVLTQPVTIPCGHNFCHDCIHNCWENADVVKCPLCNEEWLGRPQLRVNPLLAQMAAKIKKSGEGKSSGHQDQAGSGDIPCGKCAGVRQRAVKSCLVCLESYCDQHLQPHLTKPALKKHKLIQPVEDLDSRLCDDHLLPFELFCTVDQQFACESCKESDHKSHKMVSLEEEADRRRTQMETERKSNDQMTRERQQKIQEIQQSVETGRKQAGEALSHSLQVMTAVVELMERSKAELTQVIQARQERAEEAAEGFIREIEGEITQIKQKNLELDEASLTKDPFMFLQNIRSLNTALPRVRDWSDVDFGSEKFSELEALDKLEATVTREIKTLCDPDWREMQRHAMDVTLDPDTANPSLMVSEDGKEVRYVERKRNLPKDAKRLDYVLYVLAKEGFSSGKFYYEVRVKNKTQWYLGVANQSVNEMSHIRLDPQNGYWTIWLRKGSEFTANTSPAVQLRVRKMPEKIGVFVDYDQGQVSFYDVEARASIFSFSGCSFTEPLFPFLSPCTDDGEKDFQPLIVAPVKCSV